MTEKSSVIEPLNNKVKKTIVMMVWNEFINDARVLKEANTLQKSRRQVIVTALRMNPETPKSERLKSGVIVKRTNGRKPGGWNHKGSTLKSLLKVISQVKAMCCMIVQVIKLKPTVIHAHDFEVLIAAWIASKFNQATIVYDAHEVSTSREGFSSLKKLIGWIEKKIMPRTGANITTTELRSKYFARAYGIDRPAVLQNRPNYYELHHSSRIREELSLTEEWPILLYQGGLQSGRGLERFVQAASKIRDAYFILIGSGRLEAKLKQMAVDLQVTSQVKFVPTVPLSELPDYTCSADIGVQPILNTCLNHYTTDSNKLFEYLLAGLPVIATDFPEIRRIVNKYNVGLLSGESLDDLVITINKLLNDKKLMNSFKSNAFKERMLLSWESQESILLEVYERLDTE